jgi:hypothetical protein|uniref:Uncharacterized protein n=1 Tax=viral metagenome TaxID=1070528 RepID=A0A6C0HDN0_9ZZZZ
MTELIHPKLLLNKVIDEDKNNITFQHFKYENIDINQLIKYKLEIKYKPQYKERSIKSVKQIC